MRLLALSSLLALAAACAPAHRSAPRAQTATPRETQEPAAQDGALWLAQRLPAGADRCAVARPYRIDDKRKILARPVMQSDALAWDPALAITGFASADYARDDGPAAQVLWLRSALPIAELQKRLDARLSIEWRATATCPIPPCPLRGEVVDGAVRLTREPWPSGIGPGAEAYCLRAARDPRALELSASRLRRMPLGELLGLPLRSTTSVLVAGEALILERMELMIGRAEAGDRAMRAENDAFGLAASDVRVEQEDVLVRTAARFRWDDLEMLARDAEQLAQADRSARARSDREPPPLEGPLEPTDYLARAALLLMQMNNALAPVRDDRRAALHALLERGLAEHPEHEPIALLLYELRMADPAQHGQAKKLAEHFASLPGSDPRWQDALRPAASLPR